ncbi:unnamed protein product [Tetraodon nigroviridis]|uniref:(spotted green pufferfish) hypothetical protein n=1 Tax=Tetraodon nigroviridis TaxID=99883 RepID=Q4T1N3_TETNG|nr:unnamed protein product [Tetraodon nigroviridis]
MTRLSSLTPRAQTLPNMSAQMFPAWARLYVHIGPKVQLGLLALEPEPRTARWLHQLQKTSAAPKGRAEAGRWSTPPQLNFISLYQRDRQWKRCVTDHRCVRGPGDTGSRASGGGRAASEGPGGTARLRRRDNREA